MKRLIDEGALGNLHRISMTAPWYRPQAYYDSGSWRGTWKGEGGGILMNQAPHSLDQFVWLGGVPQRVQSIASTRLHNIEVEKPGAGDFRLRRRQDRLALYIDCRIARWRAHRSGGRQGRSRVGGRQRCADAN
jgi:predicted dehydrogenase